MGKGKGQTEWQERNYIVKKQFNSIKIRMAFDEDGKIERKVFVTNKKGNDKMENKSMNKSVILFQ